jgi:hypothetical protein
MTSVIVSFLLRGIKKPWCRSGPRFVVSASAALPPVLHLDQGTDLPSTALPVGALPCVMKALMRRCIAVRSLLAVVGGRTPPGSVGCGGGAAGVYGGPSDRVKETTSFVLRADDVDD